MPRIASTSFSTPFAAMVGESKLFGETNDCAVKAVALSVEVPYAEAYEALRKAGRKSRKGTYRFQTRNAIEALGGQIRVWSRGEYLAMIASYPGCATLLQSITTHHPRRYPKVWGKTKGRTFLFFTSRHVAVVKDGETHDWTVNTAKRVTEIWEITPKL